MFVEEDFQQVNLLKTKRVDKARFTCVREIKTSLSEHFIRQFREFFWNHGVILPVVKEHWCLSFLF